MAAFKQHEGRYGPVAHIAVSDAACDPNHPCCRCTGLASPLEATRHQLLLGDDAFVEKYGQDQQSYELHEIPRKQRKTINLPLSEYRNRYPDRNEAMARAYLTGSYTMAEIGNYFGVHYMTVSRAVHQHEIKENKSC